MRTSKRIKERGQQTVRSESTTPKPRQRQAAGTVLLYRARLQTAGPPPRFPLWATLPWQHHRQRRVSFNLSGLSSLPPILQSPPHPMGFFSLSNCYLDQGTLSSAISEADFLERGDHDRKDSLASNCLGYDDNVRGFRYRGVGQVGCAGVS